VFRLCRVVSCDELRFISIILLPFYFLTFVFAVMFLTVVRPFSFPSLLSDNIIATSILLGVFLFTFPYRFVDIPRISTRLRYYGFHVKYGLRDEKLTNEADHLYQCLVECQPACQPRHINDTSRETIRRKLCDPFRRKTKYGLNFLYPETSCRCGKIVV